MITYFTLFDNRHIISKKTVWRLFVDNIKKINERHKEEL